MLEAGGRVQQTRHLVAAQHNGELARVSQPDELARQVRRVDCMGEEEAQHRHDAVHGRHRPPGILLLDSEAAHVIRGRRVRRPTEEGREPTDIAGVVALRFPAEPAHVHVVDQPLPQRTDGAIEIGMGHRQAPW
jgi:hypothetical protein